MRNVCRTKMKRARKIPLIPDLAEQYRGGLTLEKLARKHNVSLATILNQLRDLGVERRRHTSRKLTAAQGRYILEQDALDIPHATIGRAVNVTRERIRQICQEAGRPTRLQRMRAKKKA